MVKGVRLEIPLKDLFSRHRCPKCGGKMKRIWYSERHKGDEFNTSQHADWHPDAEVKLYRYKYVCTKCKQ